MAASDAAASLAYWVANSTLGVAVRLHFHRVEVRHRDRLPARGPLLIASNHPAAFTDVLVLGTHLPRRIHFLAMSGIFKPWIRGFGLRLAGALPLYRREDDPQQTFRNDTTFQACHEILDRDGAVLIFPEGTSETDRRLARMKTGAARLALAQEERPGQQGRLTLLPIGLHFEDRTRFQSDVILSVGKPIDLTEFRMHAASDPREAVVWLTAALQAGLEELILHIPEPEVTSLVHDLDRLYLDELKAGGDPRHELELALLLRAGAGWPPQRIALALATAVVLGIFGLLYFRWLGRERGRLRVALLAVSHGRMVARIRAERRELVAMFDQARADFLAATGTGAAGTG